VGSFGSPAPAVRSMRVNGSTRTARVGAIQNGTLRAGSRARFGARLAPSKVNERRAAGTRQAPIGLARTSAQSRGTLVAAAHCCCCCCEGGDVLPRALRARSLRRSLSGQGKKGNATWAKRSSAAVTGKTISFESSHPSIRGKPHRCDMPLHSNRTKQRTGYATT
jgi:hypothetical protein